MGRLSDDGKLGFKKYLVEFDLCVKINRFCDSIPRWKQQ